MKRLSGSNLVTGQRSPLAPSILLPVGEEDKVLALWWGWKATVPQRLEYNNVVGELVVVIEPVQHDARGVGASAAQIDGTIAA